MAALPNANRLKTQNVSFTGTRIFKIGTEEDKSRTISTSPHLIQILLSLQ